MARVIPSNVRQVTTTVTVDSPFAQQFQSLAMVIDPFGPMSHGTHLPQLPIGPMQGLYGSGVHRAAGRTPGPLQHFNQPPRPVASPQWKKLGIGAMVSGSPGLPGTNGQATIDMSLARMSVPPGGRRAMGG